MPFENVEEAHIIILDITISFPQKMKEKCTCLMVRTKHPALNRPLLKYSTNVKYFINFVKTIMVCYFTGVPGRTLNNKSSNFKQTHNCFLLIPIILLYDILCLIIDRLFITLMSQKHKFISEVISFSLGLTRRWHYS